ncbi:spidroin-2-like [Caloenas nicobarica]|uniref:spidroin-2-like n=1 Tax=Caloenas nicobarica TaxID=187106 RepID=UPI0032B7EF40
MPTACAGTLSLSSPLPPVSCCHAPFAHGAAVVRLGAPAAGALPCWSSHLLPVTAREVAAPDPGRPAPCGGAGRDLQAPARRLTQPFGLIHGHLGAARTKLHPGQRAASPFPSARSLSDQLGPGCERPVSRRSAGGRAGPGQHGPARHGPAQPGTARPGLPGRHSPARPSTARHSPARTAWARQGLLQGPLWGDSGVLRQELLGHGTIAAGVLWALGPVPSSSTEVCWRACEGNRLATAAAAVCRAVPGRREGAAGAAPREAAVTQARPPGSGGAGTPRAPCCGSGGGGAARRSQGAAGPGGGSGAGQRRGSAGAAGPLRLGSRGRSGWGPGAAPVRVPGPLRLGGRGRSGWGAGAAPVRGPGPLRLGSRGRSGWGPGAAQAGVPGPLRLGSRGRSGSGPGAAPVRGPGPLRLGSRGRSGWGAGAAPVRGPGPLRLGSRGRSGSGPRAAQAGGPGPLRFGGRGRSGWGPGAAQAGGPGPLRFGSRGRAAQPVRLHTARAPLPVLLPSMGPCVVSSSSGTAGTTVATRQLRSDEGYEPAGKTGLAEQRALSGTQENKKKDAHKSMRTDGIHPRELAEVITKPLSVIRQQSWLPGEVPGDRRSADVMPIYKKGQKEGLGGYRPVS